MPRQKNTRPTNIYWLYDTRPETVAVHGPDGQPFYCDKTVRSIEQRLCGHRWDARHQLAHKTHTKIIECGEHIRTQLIEVVPLEINWVEREQFWIAQLRALNRDTTNISMGGGGAAGAIRTTEQRALLSRLRTGKKHSPETRAKIGATQQGMKKKSKGRKPYVKKIRASKPLKLAKPPKSLKVTKCPKAVKPPKRSKTIKPSKIFRAPKLDVSPFAHLALISHRDRFWYLYD